MAPLLLLGEESRPHWCVDKWNRPTPVRRRLTLTKTVNPTSPALVLGMKTPSLDLFSACSIYNLSTETSRYLALNDSLIDSAQAVQTGVSLGEYLRTHIKDHTGYDQGPGIHEPRRVSLIVGKIQLASCLKVWVTNLLEWDAGIQ